MGAYAALVSVMQILDQLQVSSPPPISIHKSQLQSLTQKLPFLQQFLEAYSHAGYTEEADPMESHIADAAYAAEDVIESYIVDQILARSTNHGEEISSIEFYQSLQTVIDEMELIEVEAMEIKQKKGVRDQLHMIRSVTDSGSSVRVAPKSPITVGFDDVLYQMLDKITGGRLDRQIIPIVGMGGIGVKRVRYESADDADDDDFEMVPYKARTKNAGGAPDAEAEEAVVIADQRRICPKLLVDAVRGLNDQQRRAVHNLGFGSVLHLQVGTVPARMISWCLSKFEPVSCCIEVPNHAPLHIAADDVYLMFGFPRGPRHVERNLRTKDKAIAQEWAALFNKTIYNIKPSEIASRMLAEVDGGVWFKRLFLMLVECCLFETAADGYVKPRIMDILRDISMIREHDWCDHMLGCLLRGHDKWVKSHHKKFNGPSIFLALFYVDRVVHFKRPVPRVFPLVKGWTTDALRDIEKVGFGKGFVEKKFNLALPPRGRPQPPLHASCRKNIEDQLIGHTRCTERGSSADYTMQLLRNAKNVALSMSSLMTMIIDAPLHIRQDLQFNNVVQTASLLIGVKGHSQDAPAGPSVVSCTQKLASEANVSLEWQHSVTTMAEVFDEKSRLEEHLEHPSFSLGLTQMLNEAVEGATAAPAVAGHGSDRLNKEVDDHGSVPLQNVTTMPASRITVESTPVPTCKPAYDMGFGAAFGTDCIVDDPVGVDDLGIRVQPASTTDTSNTATNAIDAVVKGLNVQHFKEMLQENPSGLAPRSTDISLGSAGVPGNEETESDIMGLINSEPTILQTQCGVAVGGAYDMGKGQDSDDEPLIHRLKRLSKAKFHANEAVNEEHNKAVMDRGKGKRAAAAAELPSAIAHVAKLRADKGKAVISASSKSVHGMAKRTAAEKRKASSMLSPFNERSVSVSSRLTSLEKDMYKWLEAHTEDCEVDEVYTSLEVAAFRSDLMSLQPQRHLTPSVIDAWTSHLNYQEMLRSQDSPRRFFFTSFPCSSTFVVSPLTADEQNVKELFWTRIEDEMEDATDFNLGNVDMVFFPICETSHINVLVVDLKGRQVVLLDVSSAQPAEPLDNIYGDIPSRVAHAFCEWMINHDFKAKGRSLQSLKVKRLQLPWGKDSNLFDCGVYAMRHLETYMGGRLKDWSIGFDAKAEQVLQQMRIKYSKVLLTSEANFKRNEVSKRVQFWLNGLRSVK